MSKKSNRQLHGGGGGGIPLVAAALDLSSVQPSAEDPDGGEVRGCPGQSPCFNAQIEQILRKFGASITYANPRGNAGGFYRIVNSRRYGSNWKSRKATVAPA